MCPAQTGFWSAGTEAVCLTDDSFSSRICCCRLSICCCWTADGCSAATGGATGTGAAICCGATGGWAVTGAEEAFSASASSSCRLETSDLRIRIDRPSDLAATGSFADPKSTMITTATIRIFHGLSNRSANISVLFGGDEAPPQSGLFMASVHVRPPAQETPRTAWRMRADQLPGWFSARCVGGQRGRRVLPDLRAEVLRRGDPAVFTQPHRQPADPARVRGAQPDTEPAVAEFLRRLTWVILRHPPARRGDLDRDVHIVGGRPEQPLIDVHRLRVLRHRGRDAEHVDAEDPVQPEEPDAFGAAAPALQVRPALNH